MQVPFRDESCPGGVKRVFWPQGDANRKRQQFAKEAAATTNKQGKKYSRADQQKIVAEKYGEFCERKPQIGE